MVFGKMAVVGDGIRDPAVDGLAERRRLGPHPQLLLPESQLSPSPFWGGPLVIHCFCGQDYDSNVGDVERLHAGWKSGDLDSS